MSQIYTTMVILFTVKSHLCLFVIFFFGMLSIHSYGQTHYVFFKFISTQKYNEEKQRIASRHYKREYTSTIYTLIAEDGKFQRYGSGQTTNHALIFIFFFFFVIFIKRCHYIIQKNQIILCTKKSRRYIWRKAQVIKPTINSEMTLNGIF